MTSMERHQSPGRTPTAFSSRFTTKDSTPGSLDSAESDPESCLDRLRFVVNVARSHVLNVLAYKLVERDEVGKVEPPFRWNVHDRATPGG